MFEPLPERDWKLFRALRVVALDRFCERVLAEIDAARSQPDKGNHERYLDVCKIINRQDHDLARMFNGTSRSSALLQLLGIRNSGLLTDDEMTGFSEETRERILSMPSDLSN